MNLINICVVYFLFIVNQVICVNLVAYISQFGLHGEIYFTQISDKQIEIKTSLETTLQYPDQLWNWEVRQFPVDYTNPDPRDRCEISKLGSKVVNFDDKLGLLQLPGNESSTWIDDYELTGQKGLWGKSLYLYSSENDFKICATITSKDTSLEHIAEAKFNTPVAGSVYFRWLAAKETRHSDTLIYANLFHVRDPKRGIDAYTKHSWKIFVTDILENDNDRSAENCNALQIVFDPKNQGTGHSIGDIDQRLGQMRISTDSKKYETRQLYRDTELVLIPGDLGGPHRRLYMVIFDPIHSGRFMACAKIRHIQPRIVKTIINGGGIKGEINFIQRSKFEPTWLNFTLRSSSDLPRQNIEYARAVSSYKITELPPNPGKANQKNYCVTGKGVYNPLNIDISKAPPPGYGTQEQYPVGDLTGKLLNRNRQELHNFYIPGGSSELSGIYWDLFLPLEGPNSVYHRGLMINQFNRTEVGHIAESNWTCGILGLYEKNGWYQKPMFTAQILFRYPVVARILLRQPEEEPWHDTTLIVEYLIHADGAQINNTENHRWAIHSEPPGKDFYNWTQRCLSAGPVYNPYRVVFDSKAPEDSCDAKHAQLCRMGDLWNRLGTLNIAGRKEFAESFSRKIFSVQNLPLSGHNNVLGKSLVIYDDFGPKARGERLGCSIVGGHYRRKAVAKNWHANGYPLTVVGQFEMVQTSEYDITNVDVDIKGLVLNSGYHVHITPVEADLEFPCEDSSLYGHWNPRKVNPRLSPPPGNGTTDEYEMGDLSGKFGTLEGHEEYDTSYNDTSLPLFGYESIIGRSIIIHKKEKMLRWACSTLERGYSPREAREIRAIASFHHPHGYAYGYIRLTQLIHSDNSQSDTIIEVKLRHPGVNDRNRTLNHNWQIFVNSVGVDATVKQTATRCVAGGYIWNPFYTQLADPLNGDLYRQECGPDNPLRCYVGDISARLGTIDVGNKRAVFTDPNFPLEGTISAMGRSIVLFGPEQSGERFSCANIEPDHDIVKYVNLQKPPRFVVAQFLEEIRSVMGLPEWMLAIDSRKTKTLHNGGCIQMIIHFMGPNAHRVENDFSKLIASGRLDSPSISIPGYVNQKRKSTLSYRQCGVRDPNEKKKAKSFFDYSNGNYTQFNRPLLALILVSTIVFRFFN